MLVLPLAAAMGQTFDVASVKPSPDTGGDSLNINLGTARHGVVTLTNTTLSECIQFAYGLSSEDQISGPDWIRDRRLRVDIVAKAPPDTPRDRLLLMTQALLAERFRLELHREPRPVAHYEISVAKGGPKLPEAKPDEPSGLVSYGRGKLHYTRVPMHSLELLLSRQLKQVVIDKTGLTGFYDFNLEWDPGDAAPEPSANTALPGIFKAIQQQLGLTLEARKTPLDVLVVDRAEKIPLGN
jgi:uncharacterized protein (TIGR03435 family)